HFDSQSAVELGLTTYCIGLTRKLMGLVHPKEFNA
ncbi:unnamed protein product, partial [marine sediment metagenome]